MANTNKVNGFRPVRYLNGAPYTGQMRKYIIPASDGTATFIGDLVKLSTAGSDDGYTAVIQAAAGDACIGAIVGMEVDPTNLNTPVYRAASTKRVVYVADDPNLIFEAQEDGDTDPLETADIGLNVNCVVGSGSTVTGASGMQIDSTSHNTTATLQLRLLGLVQRVDNENVLSAGGQAYTRWEVKINNHQLGSSTGVAGV
jgi:hypothetical protein